MTLHAQQGASDIYRLAFFFFLIDSNKDGLLVTVATVAYHARCPSPPLSFNSRLMSSPGIGVRDDRDGRSERESERVRERERESEREQVE